MKVTPLSYELPAPYEISTDGVDMPRSKGLHLGTILGDTARKLKLYTPIEDDELSLLAHIGIAWENYLATLISARPIRQGSEFYFHPGEYCEDGIYMNPDGIEFTAAGETIVHEIKTTAKKAGQAVEKHWKYLAQLKSYCRAVGVNKGVLHILYLSGFYNPPFAVHEVLEIEFTDRELTENWQMVLREAKRFR